MSYLIELQDRPDPLHEIIRDGDPALGIRVATKGDVIEITEIFDDTPHPYNTADWDVSTYEIITTVDREIEDTVRKVAQYERTT